MDNVGSALLSLFEASTIQLWVDIMYASMDSPPEIGMQPSLNRNYGASAFWILFLCFSAFFVLACRGGMI